MTNQNLIRLKLLAALIALACGIGAIVTVYELYQSTPPATSIPPASAAAAAPAPASPHALSSLAIRRGTIRRGFIVGGLRPL